MELYTHTLLVVGQKGVTTYNYQRIKDDNVFYISDKNVQSDTEVKCNKGLFSMIFTYKIFKTVYNGERKDFLIRSNVPH